MPRIPEFTSTRLIPGESSAIPAAPGPSSMEYGAWERAGNQFEVLGHRAMNVFGELQRQQERNEIAKESLEYENKLTDWMIGVKANLDSRTDTENYDKFIDSEIQKARLEIGPRAKGYSYESRIDALKLQAFDKAFNDYAKVVKTYAAAKKLHDSRNNAIGELETLRDKTITSAANQLDQKLRQEEIDQFSIKANTLSIMGTITPKQAQDQIEYLKTHIEAKRTKIAYDKVIQNPEAVDQIIKDYDVLPEHQGELRKQAEIEIDRRWARKERLRQDTQRKVDFDFFQRVTEPEKYGSLTIGDINTSALETPRKDYYLGMIGNAGKQGSVKTEGAFALGILDNILSGKTKGMRDDILKDASKDPTSDDPPKLSFTTAKELLKAYWGKVKPEGGTGTHYTSDPWFALTKNYFRDQLGIKETEDLNTQIERMISGGAKPSSRNMQYYFNATAQLMREVEAKGLRGEKIWQKGQEIWADTMAEIKGKGKSSGQDIPPSAPPPNGREGRYSVDGIEWKWTKAKGWYK